MSELIKQFKALKNDKQRWQWVIENKDKGLRLELDNDCTIVIDTNIDERDHDDVEYCSSFDGFVGWNECVIDLLQTIGIDADSC